MAASALFIAMTASVPHSYVAIASSTMYLSGGIGSLVGMASSAAVLQTIVHRGLQGVVAADFPNRDEFIRRCLEDIGFLQQLRGGIKDKIVDVYVLGFRGAYSKSSSPIDITGLTVKQSCPSACRLRGPFWASSSGSARCFELGRRLFGARSSG